MALPEFTLRQLLEAGVHFGHQTHRWNPRMGPYIYGERGGIHIMDLTQTVPLLDQALQVVQQTVAKGGRILFVGTKRQAQRAVAEAAERSAQYYMNHRWLGGTLTNWKTISNSISRLKSIDEQLEGGAEGLTKKERLGLERQQNKLQLSLGGVRDMGGTPDLVFVIDANKEELAVLEAKKLGIPVIAILDSNSSPDGIDYPIPGNDDAARAISLYCDLIARAALDGMTAQMGAAGVDIGAMEEAPVEEVIVEEIVVVEEVAVEKPEAKEVASGEAPAEAESAPAEAEKAPEKAEKAAKKVKKTAEKAGKAPEKAEKAPAKKPAAKKKAAAKKKPAAEEAAAAEEAPAGDEAPADAEAAKTEAEPAVEAKG